MAYEVFNDFTFNGKRLSTDFKGTLYENNIINISSGLSATTTNYNNQDGETFLRSKYNPRILTFKIYFENDNFNIEDFKQWLVAVKEPKPLTFINDNKYINGVFTNISEFTVYNNRQATCTCEFTCYDPYWYFISNSTFTKANPTVNQTYTFNNPSTVESTPLIKIETNGVVSDVVIEINGLRIKLKKIYNTVYISSKYHTCYSYIIDEYSNMINEYECINGIHRFTFPKMHPNENTFKLVQGVIKNINIEMNSKTI